MSVRQVVVDGSNIATEGRSLPSLRQLDEAVREFLAENPDDTVTVVVDASFGHRVDPSELPLFEEAEAAGEIVSPPAGALGRGDAFLLRISEKVGATVLSNDSFQEFHGEHPWLFEKGRLIGGKPVPGVGWIFMERSPVRGQKSREVVKEAKRKKKAETSEEASGLDRVATRTKPRDKKLDRAIARATQEVIQPNDARRSKRRRSGTPPAEPVNEPLPFITFIAAHPLGSEVVGVVSEFSSHGAFVESFGAKCYIPLSAMGDPPPRRAREMLNKGDERNFVVQALDPQRRGIELALPGFEKIAGSPTPETVEAEIHPAAPAKRARKKPAPAVVVPEPEDLFAPKAPAPAAVASKEVAPKKAAAKKSARKAAAAGGAAGKEAPAKKAAATKKAVGGKKAAAVERVAPAKKAAPARKAAPAKKASAAKKAARQATKAGAEPRKAAQAKKSPPGTKKAAGKAASARTKKAPAEIAGNDGAMAARKNAPHAASPALAPDTGS